MAAFPEHFTIWNKLGVYALRGFAGAVLFFLILPILVIVPLSFNSQPYFTFTAEMLAFEADAYSLRWYKTIVENPNWLLAIQNSFIVGIFATIVATLLGTVAAVGLASSEMPLRRTITALLLSPMIVPLIIIAAGRVRVPYGDEWGHAAIARSTGGLMLSLAGSDRAAISAAHA